MISDCRKLPSSIRYLLLQIRDDDDPMAQHEIECFASALMCETERISICDLLNGTPSASDLQSHDVLLVGGSGDYSTTSTFDWLDKTYDFLREVHATRTPMFGSCWGFQALAKAFGGEVVHDIEQAELGTIEITLTPAGAVDPIFAELGLRFMAPIGHEDCVIRLPENCTLLAKSDKANQAFRFEDAPIYATQFHPELDRDGLIMRIDKYRKYVEKISKTSFEHFVEQCQETPQMGGILRRFVNMVME